MFISCPTSIQGLEYSVINKRNLDDLGQKIDVKIYIFFFVSKIWGAQKTIFLQTLNIYCKV